MENNSLLSQALAIYYVQGEAAAHAWMDTLSPEQQDQLQVESGEMVEKITVAMQPIFDTICDTAKMTVDTLRALLEEMEGTKLP